ncbi:MAG: glycerophosphodiester phosphodiesterase family protein [Alphaproteobacteria bacterium]
MKIKLPQVMGHRGAPSLAPENTLQGFEAAFNAGALWTETDVCVLGDGTPVIFHDSTLDRCTDHKGLVTALRASDLASVNANRQFPETAFHAIPTLAEALSCFQRLGMGVNLELKLHEHVEPATLVDAVTSVLSEHTFPTQQILLSSFDFEVLRLLKQALPDLALAVIAEEASDEVFEVARETGSQALNLWWETLSHENVRRARSKGLSVNIWTANEPEKVRSMVDWGVEGIMSDCPQNFSF